MVVMSPWTCMYGVHCCVCTAVAFFFEISDHQMPLSLSLSPLYSSHSLLHRGRGPERRDEHAVCGSSGEKFCWANDVERQLHLGGSDKKEKGGAFVRPSRGPYPREQLGERAVGSDNEVAGITLISNACNIPTMQASPCWNPCRLPVDSAWPCNLMI